MRQNTPSQEVQKLSDFNSFAWNAVFQDEQYGLLTISKIEGSIPSMPKQFLPPTYALEFVVKGHTTGIVNGKLVELQPNDAFFVFADQILKEVETSDNLEIYIVGFTTQFADSINMHISQEQLAQIMMRPVFHMTDHQMKIILQYIEFMRVMVAENNPKALLNIVRSLFYYLDAYMSISPQLSQSLSRAEQICGHFLSMVELYCREQHMVEWYAGKLFLAPKYLSNVVQQTLHMSPNRCIDRALVLQAKSLLVSTSLSIQEISNRLGFQNQSHFGTFFKRHTGKSPKEFRTQK